MTAHYELSIAIDSDRVWSMKDALDAACDGLERLGLTEDEYRAEVHGPPELNVGLRMK